MSYIILSNNFSVPIDELHRIIRRISVRRQMVILFAKCVDRDKAVVNRVPVSYQYSLFLIFWILKINT